MKDKAYILDIDSIDLNYSELFLVLPEYCKNKLSMCNNIELKKIRIIAWYVLYKILLTKYSIDLTKCEIYENDYGKPYIEEIYFNITHSKKYIGIIISEEECGIDIEKIELKIDKNKFAKKILTEKEYEEFLMEDSINYLIKKWTKIETYYKILGKGISLSNIKLEINDKDIYTVNLNEEYILSFGPHKCDIINVLDLNIL